MGGHGRPALIGESPSFRAAVSLIERYARVDACVFLLGETGTGKEIAARAIHYYSQRRDHPFVPINCGALPDTLIERELFGHVRGAFTDAREAGSGLLAQAQGGTLFLDEVDSLSTKGQVCLLRFLQDSTYRPIGGTREEQANVRVIAAASPRIHKMVECGDFRSDLAYRLNILSIDMPPLRKRPGDVRLLAEHVLAQLAVRYRAAPKRLDVKSLTWLERYEWPGNVRELENLVHRGFLLCEGDVISLDVAEAAANQRSGVDRRHTALNLTNFNRAKADAIRDFEVAFLTQLMIRCQGNVTSAAKLVGKDRRVLGRMLKRRGISRQVSF